MPKDFGARDFNVQQGDIALASHDYQQALVHYGAAAKRGLAAGQHNLGLMYQEGRGVAVNLAEAMKWYRLAAEQGPAISQVALGLMYYHGQGVPVDYAQALKWTRLGAEQGFAAGEFTLGQMYANGRGVPRDYGEASSWFERAAQQGYPGAAQKAKESYDMAVVLHEAHKAGAIIVGTGATSPPPPRRAEAPAPNAKPAKPPSLLSVIFSPLIGALAGAVAFGIFINLPGWLLFGVSLDFDSPKYTFGPMTVLLIAFIAAGAIFAFITNLNDYRRGVSS